MQFRIGLWAAAALAVGTAISSVVSAQSTASPTTRDSSTDMSDTTGTLQKETITAQLDQARALIAPAIGSNIYTVTPEQIQAMPQGENAPFQQVLLQMPGVVEDQFGQEHIRGDHGNVTYRINGVLLPEPLSGFGQELDTHIIDSVSLIDGSLPAQFGFKTAGIIDVTTKSGASLQSNEISLYGGTDNTVEPSFEFGRSSGNWDYFVSGNYKSNDLGIENPTPSENAIHDNTDQSRLFTYASYHIDDTSRLSFLVNGDYSDFQIPDQRSVPQSFALAGVPFDDSATENENQTEQKYYAVASYQKSTDDYSTQMSVFSSYGQIHFYPDTTGDLIFQGVAGDVFNNYWSNGVQWDNSYELARDHTVRFGLIAQYTAEQDNTNTWVFPIDPTTGVQTSDVPFSIADESKNDAAEGGVYVQDEWRVTRSVTFNYGLRYDCFDADFDNEDQVSPRANLVWKIDKSSTAHAGYSRYFVPPTVQYVSPDTIAKFVNTTNAAPDLIDDPPRVEKDNYYDVGISHQISQPWNVNLDGFVKDAHDLVDSGQFGNAVILSDFNYKDGYDYGAEISTNYQVKGFSTYGNFSWVTTGGRNIISQEFEIDPAELAYIQDHYIHLDHESEFTASGGVSYNVTKNDLIYSNITYGNGLRTGFANTQQEPYYFPVSAGYEHDFPAGPLSRDQVKLRFDVINVFDHSYQIRSGTGIGVAAPSYGQRRTFLMGIAYDF